jgi:hypothetical protein
MLPTILQGAYQLIAQVPELIHLRPKLIDAGLSSIPQQLRAPLQQKELGAQLVQHVSGGLGRKTPNSHAVQADLVIGYARSHAPDLLLGSVDLMMTGH